jgi:ADP-ribose pyrophosphatase
MKVRMIDKETVYDGWMKVSNCTFQLFFQDGSTSSRFSREVIERGHAVAVLPYDPNTNEVLLVEQFRPGAFVANCSPIIHELIAGMIENGESASDVAHRETIEEAGLVINEFTPIVKYLNSPGGSSETVQLFYAKADLSNYEPGYFGLKHENEYIKSYKTSLNHAATMIEDGLIINAMTIIAIQWLLLNKGNI